MEKKINLTKDQLYMKLIYLSESKQYSSSSLVMAFIAGYFVCLVSFVLATNIIP